MMTGRFGRSYRSTNSCTDSSLADTRSIVSPSSHSGRRSDHAQRCGWNRTSLNMLLRERRRSRCVFPMHHLRGNGAQGAPCLDGGLGGLGLGRSARSVGGRQATSNIAPHIQQREERYRLLPRARLYVSRQLPSKENLPPYASSTFRFQFSSKYAKHMRALEHWAWESPGEKVLWSAGA